MVNFNVLMYFVDWNSQKNLMVIDIYFAKHRHIKLCACSKPLQKKQHDAGALTNSLCKNKIFFIIQFHFVYFNTFCQEAFK